MATARTQISGYERRKSRKRAQILAAAMELFKEKGVSQVSVAQVAQRAGVSQVSIYNHFRDKHGLVETAFTRLTEEKTEEYRRILRSEAPWIERLRTVVRDKKKTLRDFRGELLETIYREYPDLIRRLAEAKLRVRESLTYPFLDEGRRLGHVPAEVCNEAVEAYLRIIMRGFDESPDIHHRTAEEPGLMDQIYDLTLFGLVRSRADRPGTG